MFPLDIRRAVLWNSRYHPSLFSHTGLSPSMVLRSSKLLIKELGRNWVQTPHLQYLSILDSVCPFPFSVALTRGIAFAFFSSGYVRCFNSPRFLSHTNVRDYLLIGSPIRTFRVQSLLAATPDIQQLATSFIGT